MSDFLPLDLSGLGHLAQRKTKSIPGTSTMNLRKGYGLGNQKIYLAFCMSLSKDFKRTVIFCGVVAFISFFQAKENGDLL